MIEIEAKIKLKSKEELLSKVEDLEQTSQNHIMDIYFDKNGELASADKVLRLRKQNEKVYLTQKGPRMDDENLLVREENETEIFSFETAKKILESLGYTPIQITEKIRDTFTVPACHTKIELDYYPFIGYYVEIEGVKERVLEIMERLGYTMDDAIAKNCTELFREYIEAQKMQFDHPHLQFTFEDENSVKNL